MTNKELKRGLESQLSDREVAELEGVTPSQYQEYERLLAAYLNGEWASSAGWQSDMEDSLRRAGCSDRQAFLLASSRSGFLTE